MTGPSVPASLLLSAPPSALHPFSTRLRQAPGHPEVRASAAATHFEQKLQLRDGAWAPALPQQLSILAVLSRGKSEEDGCVTVGLSSSARALRRKEGGGRFCSNPCLPMVVCLGNRAPPPKPLDVLPGRRSFAPPCVREHEYLLNADGFIRSE